jgi:biopolymer transport protein ExbD
MKIRRCKLEAGVPSVAMADIAFNLVLFFIMLARSQDDSHLAWEAARVPSVQTLGQSRVSVTVDRDNKVYLNGTQVSVNQLAGGIQALLGNEAAGNRLVQLKIHKDTQAATFEPIIEAVSQAGGEVVHILQQERN